MNLLAARGRALCRAVARALLPGLIAVGLPLAQAGPHEHGVVRMDLAQDGALLTAHLRAPLDSLLGFERAPRTEAERQAARQLLDHLGQPGAVLQPEAAAACELVSAQVQADVLQGRAAAAADGHAELVAQYQWRCANAASLRTVTVTLFDAYRRTRRVEIQVAGPRGQSRAVALPSARSVPLGR